MDMIRNFAIHVLTGQGRRFASRVVFCTWLCSPWAWADALVMEIEGLDPAVAENVRAHVGSSWIAGGALATDRRRDRFRVAAEQRAALALRPFGYYFPVIRSRLEPVAGEEWRLVLEIDPGPPVEVRHVDISVSGPGAGLPALVQWREQWPLNTGSRLDQVTWEERKQRALELATREGYLSAGFARHAIELDLESNRADLVLELETGPRARMGEVRIEQDTVRSGVLEPIPRFRAGDPYRSVLVERLRNDLWRTGYFEDIEVVEQRHLERTPPVVDFVVRLTERNRTTHQGSLGYGTDTEVRIQYRWQRHLLSRRGDSLAVGLGWQQRYEEWLASAEYRLPRRERAREHWLWSSVLRSRVQDLEVREAVEDDPVTLTSGQVEDAAIRFGKARLRHVGDATEPVNETMYVQYLYERNDFVAPGQVPNEAVQAFFDQAGLAASDHSLVIGAEWDWPVIRGSAFATQGHHERAWLFTSSEAWGSDREFTQAYFSARWNRIFSERWKLLLRGEIGYTSADVNEFTLDVDGQSLHISATELPFLYRFKAGGSRSVRGYGYEDLSNNGIGSNHILTASAELEYRFADDWSLATFYDLGNAFNDWDERNLMEGFGVGVRWYTVAGAVRLDFAQALDLSGQPWQIHLTIGTPLL